MNERTFNENITNLETLSPSVFERFPPFSLSPSLQAGPLPSVLRGGPGDGERRLRRRDGDPDGDAVPHARSAHRRNGLLLPHVRTKRGQQRHARPRPSINHHLPRARVCVSERALRPLPACLPTDEWKSGLTGRRGHCAKVKKARESWWCGGRIIKPP